MDGRLDRGPRLRPDRRQGADRRGPGAHRREGLGRGWLPSRDPAMNTTQGPTWPGLAIAALPMLGAMAVLAWRGLGQVRPLAVGATRLVVQMSLLGLVLGSIFAADSPWLVLAVALIMLAASAYTVSSRQRAGSRTLRLEGFGAMLIGAAVVMAVATRLALGVTPWYDPRTVLPILGMILGNSVNGVALA